MKKTVLLLILSFFCSFAMPAIPPQSTGTYSYLDVSFQWEFENSLNYEARNLFGLLLPQGWRVSDKNDFTIHFSSKDPVTGQFAYCQFYSDFLEDQYPAPEGYYWWGGRSFDKTRLNRADNFSFSLRIYTDDQIGSFNLKYTFGDDPSNKIKNHLLSEAFEVTVTAGNEFPLKTENTWELITGNWNSSYYSDKDYDGYFQRYYGWNGGDIGISTLLPDGRSVWTWGDYHSGVVNSERNRLSELSQFPRNALIVQDGENFSSFRMLTEDKLGEIKPVFVYKDDTGKEINGGQEWYWPMGGSVYYRNGIPELQIILEHTVTTGAGGAWGMEAISCDVAVFSLPDMQLKKVVKDRYVGSIAFANIALRDDDGIVYVYGEKNHGICASATFVARNTDGDLSGTWEYYNAKDKTWSTDHSWENASDWLAYRIVNNPIFVFKDCGKYYAFEQPACFGRTTYIFDAQSPIGPFTNRRAVGELPAEISTGNFFCYIPALHQQFSKNGELLYCVSKNNRDMEWYNYPGSGDIYLPYFFRVKNWRNKLNLVDNDITGKGAGILSAQQENNLNALTDKDEKTVYSVVMQEEETWIQYQSPKPLFLRRYSITSAENAPEKDPLHWQIQGSKDGINWTVIDERFYSEFDERSQTNGYVVNKDYAFTGFRMNILATNGSPDLQIAEWQLFGQYETENTAIPEITLKEPESIIISPNPVRDNLNIKGIDKLIEKVTVNDINGRVLYAARPHSIDFQIPANHWDKGIYFIQIFTGQGNVKRKILKM